MTASDHCNLQKHDTINSVLKIVRCTGVCVCVVIIMSYTSRDIMCSAFEVYSSWWALCNYAQTVCVH